MTTLTFTDGRPDCAECALYLVEVPHLMAACASVGIEHGKTSSQVLMEYIVDYHANGHRTALEHPRNLLREQRHSPPDRLYGVPGAEVLWATPEACYEADIEPWLSDRDDWSGSPSEWKGSTIEEWTVHDPTDHFPSVDEIIERIHEWVADHGMLDEFGHDDVGNAAGYPDVTAAFERAIKTWANHVSYRMAKDHVATHIVTWDEDGRPLLDNEQMYMGRVGS